jgi:hypothetical protein
MTAISQAPGQAPSPQETGTSLAWLADAPLFIDKDQIAAFYDAVVRPEGRRGKTVISLERYEGQTTKLEGAVEGEISVSKLITTLLPFLDVKAKASAGAEHEEAGSETRGQTVELYPIETPQRQLVQLTLHYLTNLPKRMKVVTDPTRPGWCDQEFISGLPRALVFLDFPGWNEDKGLPGTKFIPMAAEVDKGEVVTVYDQLKSSRGESPPAAPERHSCASQQEYDAAWIDYWAWFEKNFSSKVATETLEKVIASGGRIQWIAYRVPLPHQGVLHLDICGRGEFDTGTFAYNLIKRGYKHGLRVVGTLKSEPDLNVLAIFEK